MSKSTARPARKTTAADAAKTAARNAEREALVAQIEEFDMDELSGRMLRRFEMLNSHYSERNSILILIQCPKVSAVKTYKAWQAEGRQVRKGEKGIMILAPAGQSKREGDVELPADDAPSQAPAAADGTAKPGRKLFRWIAIFDISQTDAVSAEQAAADTAPAAPAAPADPRTSALDSFLS